jgi:hypothetical protein
MDTVIQFTVSDPALNLAVCLVSYHNQKISNKVLHHLTDFDYIYRGTTQTHFTEHCSTEVSNPASYSGGLKLKSGPGLFSLCSLTFQASAGIVS